MLVAVLRRHRWVYSIFFAVVIVNFAIIIITTSPTSTLLQQNSVPTLVEDFGYNRDTNSQDEEAGNPRFDFGNPFKSHDLSAPHIRTNISLGWGHDLNEPTDGSLGKIRIDHPRLFASNHRWRRLPELIAVDPYLANWNKTIFDKATIYYHMAPCNYTIDGELSGNGVLDAAREIQLRIKHWAYSYRMSEDPKWISRIWEEIVVASGNSTHYFGNPGDNWNTRHWLDVGEFIVAFAYAYDWLYDAWSSTQRDAIMWSIISLGLKKGIEAYATDLWFLSVDGNWNCVSNGGMIIGSLAIYHEDPTQIAAKLLPLAIAGAQQHCTQAVQPDGSWTETPDYWYFGTQAHAQITSALLVATGSTQKMLITNPKFRDTGLYHMYVSGNRHRFNYGDCGPNKITATANSMLFYGDQFQIPIYALYQRDRPDAPDPLSMFWYNPQVSGSWFVGLPLDHDFTSPGDAWVSMRSSWTDPKALYVAMKAGNVSGHQTHGHIDAGDFVLDAIGERWAVQLCQADYLSTGYFSGETQNSPRWLYYRCRTEGQNTIVHGASNQIVDAAPSTSFATTGDCQWTVDQKNDNSSSAYWIADLTTAYNGTVIRRGLRTLDGRKQVLIQDEIVDSSVASQWRMHTYASIGFGAGREVAHLSLNGKSLKVVLQSTSNMSFRALKPIRLTNSPPLPEGDIDPPNSGVSVLAIDIPAGTETVAVIFSPMWDADYFAAEPPPLVPLKDWSLISHLEDRPVDFHVTGTASNES